MQVPHTSPPRWPPIAPGRFAERIRQAASNETDLRGCRIALVGLPDDLGVRLNNGRPGAAHGPAAFRAALARYGTTWDAGANRQLGVLVADAGDVIPTSPNDFKGNAVDALTETHRRVTEALASIHASGMVPVCIGGGHDLTFPAVRALSEYAGHHVGGTNVDAHLDVRDTPGSGMAFRSLIDGGFVDPNAFNVIGAGRFANAPEHVKWLFGRGSHVSTSAAMPRHEAQSPGHRFLTFDLDVLDGSHAPGVSAVNPCGMSVREAVNIVDAAGRDPAVRHFDIMELSPPHDDPAFDPSRAESVGRTARIAALLFLTFVAAFAERGS